MGEAEVLLEKGKGERSHEVHMTVLLKFDGMLRSLQKELNFWRRRCYLLIIILEGTTQSFGQLEECFW